MRNDYLLLKIFPLTVLCLFSACMAVFAFFHEITPINYKICNVVP